MRISTPLLAAAALFAASTTAQALTAQQTIQKETAIINANGVSEMVRSSAAKIVPGERIVYTLNYINDEAAPASDIVLTMPIPKEVTFVEGSADIQGAPVTYSADEGQTFSARQSVMTIDGAGNIRAAGAEDLTHVRWVIAGPVNAGANGELAFSAIVK
jgi:uncharacterized repeat protein (TIGR01451 family)